ncbi:MAG: PCRF domain-containing protein, partial [Proteobacteria bacterium]|nr:PCRF domain-containing protein [Pseudomonadota bacterium]
MYESLLSIKTKAEELTAQLNTPEVAGDIKKYTKVTREYKSIEDVYNAFNVFLELESTVKDSKEMLGIETDPEMIEFAKAEIKEAEAKMPALADELKI